jgi:N-acetylmuramoyl-L-alanine amidase
MYFKVIKWSILCGLCLLNTACVTHHKNTDLVELNDIPALHAQVIARFPELAPSSRKYVNNRGTFKAYKHRGSVIIENNNALSADIYINNNKLNFNHGLSNNTVYQYNLSSFTRDGTNTFKVENIQPYGASLTLRFPFPSLLNSTESNIDFSAVDTLINNDIEAGFPGAVLAVIQHGKLIKLSAYGDAKKYQQASVPLLKPQVMKTDTVFDLASNTKIFATNLALMKLVSEQQLDINKPIHFYLPQYQGEGREQKTVKDLLTHKAGYSPVFKFYKKDNPYGAAFYSQQSALTKRLLLTQLPFKFTDKDKHVYSDINYIILGVLIEKITGRSLDTYLEQSVYKPLGLYSTLFNPLNKGVTPAQCAATELAGNSRDGRVQFRHIRTHVLQGEVHDELAYYSLGGVAGHAGLFSNASDLAVLAQLFLNRGGYGNNQVFTDQVLAQFLAPELTNETYGLGFRLAGNNKTRRWHFGPYASAQAYGHTGWTGTVTVIDPTYDLAIILLTNARHSEITGSKKQFEFVGKQFETAKYGSVVSLLYEAILNANN